MTQKPPIPTAPPALLAAIVACVVCTSCASPGGSRATPLVTGPLSAPRDARPEDVAKPRPQRVAAPEDVPQQLHLQEAFRLAMAANSDVRVVALGSEADRERIGIAEGEFDPTVFAQISRGRTDDPVAGVPVTHANSAEGALAVGVSKRSVTGTTVSLTALTDYERDIDAPGPLNPTYDPEVALSVEQDLLKDFGTGVNRTAIVIAQNNAAISREQWRDTVIRTLFEVERAYWELHFATADLSVREQQLARAQSLVKTAETQVKVGISAPQDVVRARSSAAAQEVSIATARNRVARLRHELLRLMGIITPRGTAQGLEPIDAPPEESFAGTLEEAVETALRHRPDQAQARLAVDSARLEERLARNQRLPSLKLFGNYALTALDDDLGDAVDTLSNSDFDRWSVGLRFEVPIPNRTGRSGYAAARLDRSRAVVRVRALAEVITRQVADALSDLHVAEERIALAQEARRLARQLLDGEETSFTLGRSDSLDVLVAQASLASAERDEIRARTDRAIALANLFRVQGILIEKKGVDVQAPGGRTW